MQGSQDKLNELLRDKLHDYEQPVPRTSREAVFSLLRAARRSGWVKNALYSIGLVVMVSSVSWYMQNHGVTTLMASVAATVTEAQPPVESPVNPTTVQPAVARVDPREVATNPALLLREEERSEATKEAHKNTEPLAPPITDAIPGKVLKSKPETVAPDESLELNNQIAIDEPQTETKSAQDRPARLKFSLGITPTLNYKRLIPIGSDGAYLHSFETPGSFDKSRWGFNTSLLAHYAFRKSIAIFAGIGYVQYQTEFSYRSSEVASGALADNEVRETKRGVSFSLGGSLPLAQSDKNLLQFNLSTQLQLTKPDPQLVLQAGLEYGWKLSPSRAISIQPTFFYSLTPLHYTGLIAYPFGAGFEVRYKLLPGGD